MSINSQFQTGLNKEVMFEIFVDFILTITFLCQSESIKLSLYSFDATWRDESNGMTRFKLQSFWETQILQHPNIFIIFDEAKSMV